MGSFGPHLCDRADGRDNPPVGLLLVGLAIALVAYLPRALAAASDSRARVRNGSYYCLVCGEPNHRTHGCHLRPSARVAGHYKKQYGRMGKLSKAIWVGTVDDRMGEIWRCAHRHDGEAASRQCARSKVRHFQLTGQGLPPLAKRRPETLDFGRRLPIPDLSEADWRALKAKYDHRCFYCGTTGVALHREHRVPLSRGGANSATNIVPSCAPCNLRKGVLTDEEFLEKLDMLEERQRIRLGQAVQRFHSPPAPTRRLWSKKPIALTEKPWAVRQWDEALEARGRSRVEPRISNSDAPPTASTPGVSTSTPRKPPLPRPEPPPGMRRCATCKRLLQLSEYGSNRSRADGLNVRCRGCAREQTRKWNQENPEKAREARSRSKAKAKASTTPHPVSVDTKRCPRCDTVKPAEDFHRDAQRSDGLQRICKACRRGSPSAD